MNPKLRGFLLITSTALLVLVFAWIVSREEATAPTTNATNSGTTNEAVNAAANATNADSLETYTEEEFHFSFRHTPAQKVTRSVSGEDDSRIVGLVVNDGTRGMSVTVMRTDNAGIVSEAFGPRDVRSVTINSVAATRAVGSSPKDGSRVDLLTFVRGDYSFILNGPADLVDAIGATWRFTQ